MPKFLFVESLIPRDASTPCSESSNPDLWFSPNRDAVMEAKKLCAQCPFIVECQEDGVRERHGVWGGIYRRDGRVAAGPQPTGRPPKQK